MQQAAYANVPAEQGTVYWCWRKMSDQWILEVFGLILRCTCCVLVDWGALAQQWIAHKEHAVHLPASHGVSDVGAHGRAAT